MSKKSYQNRKRGQGLPKKKKDTQKHLNPDELSRLEEEKRAAGSRKEAAALRQKEKRERESEEAFESIEIGDVEEITAGAQDSEEEVPEEEAKAQAPAEDGAGALEPGEQQEEPEPLEVPETSKEEGDLLPKEELTEEEAPPEKKKTNPVLRVLQAIGHGFAAFHRKFVSWSLFKKTLFVALLACALMAAVIVGVFTYEYRRLQAENTAAQYSDEIVEQVVENDKTDKELKKSEASMNEQLEGLEETEAVSAEGDIFSDDSVYNILLLGTDDRTKEFSANARADTCILLSLNQNTGKVSLISFERGTGVPILWGPYEGQWDWLTHMFRYGGADMMVQEIRDQYKVDVSRYIRINIRTLVKLIDAIGGVDIELTAAEAEHLNHPEGTYTAGYAKGVGVEDEVQEVHEGVNHLNGATAMVYARTRAIDDDWHRIVRQRNVITAAAKRLSSLNAAEMISMLDSIVPLVQTDLSETEVASLLTLAPRFMSAEVNQMTIPADGTYGSMKGIDGRGLFAVDFDTNAKLIRSMLYDLPVVSESKSSDADTETMDSVEATGTVVENKSSAEVMYSEPYGTGTSPETQGSSASDGTDIGAVNQLVTDEWGNQSYPETDEASTEDTETASGY